jgi:uncharacterized protein (TIGR02271 family)
MMLTKEEFVKTHPDIRVGMTAYTTDGEKLGVIERIEEDNLMIERGWFFHKDFVIPYDDIEDVREDQVIVRQRREDFEEQRRGESWETEESDLTGRAGEMGERAGERVEEAGERVKESGERLGERAKEFADYRGREEEEARIPVREEELEAQKRAKESEVGIHKEVRTETQHMEVPVQKEDVVVERTPVDESRPVEMGEEAFEEEEIRIPVKEEEVEVTKRPTVREEVRVRKETRTETEPVSGEVRKEEVKVSPAKPKGEEKK